MGSSFSSRVVDNVSNFVRRKRKLEYEDCEELDKVIEVLLHTPKRKKLETTAQYIYQALFKEGKNSDITVEALDHEFSLHKVYLCQSPYFASMFGGSWLETTKSFIGIDIVDPSITIQSLNIVFGSLYNDEVTLNPVDVISVLATATMFQLDGMIEKCREVMLETINTQTALMYYNAACQYGDTQLRDTCTRWFLVNLMTYYFDPHFEKLKLIPVSLMTKLVAHPDLFVMKAEINLYTMLVQWVYINLHPENTESLTYQDIREFFISRKDEQPFLLTQEGEQFVTVFKGLRLHNLISHHMDVEIIMRDNIIPKNWIFSVIVRQWVVTLRVNQNEEKGPIDCSNAIFLTNSLRCGRILEEREKHIWRWTGFNYGIDLIMIADEKSLSVKRSHRPEYEQLLSLQTIRHVTIRVIVVTLNEQRQISNYKCSGIRNLTLTKSEEVTLITFDKEMKFPLFVAANILFVTPPSSTKEQIKVVQTIT